MPDHSSFDELFDTVDGFFAKAWDTVTEGTENLNDLSGKLAETVQIYTAAM
jgi:hypothetical protein